jgi:hypothetical protein
MYHQDLHYSVTKQRRVAATWWSFFLFEKQKDQKPHLVADDFQPGIWLLVERNRHFKACHDKDLVQIT